MTFVRREIRGFIRVLKSSRKFVIVEFILGADSGVGRFCDWPAVAWA